MQAVDANRTIGRVPNAPLIILNPVAGGGRAGRLAGWVSERLAMRPDARFEVTRRRRRITRLDDVHPQPRQLPRDLDLLRCRHRRARRLLAIAQCRIEYQYPVTHRLPPCRSLRSSQTARAALGPSTGQTKQQHPPRRPSLSRCHSQLACRNPNHHRNHTSASHPTGNKKPVPQRDGITRGTTLIGRPQHGRPTQ